MNVVKSLILALTYSELLKPYSKVVACPVINNPNFFLDKFNKITVI